MGRPGSPVAQVLDHLARGPARLGTARLLTVDGPSGSGKSTLAGQVSARTGAAVLPVDDLLDGWHGGVDAAVADLVRGVLAPLSQGRPGRYRRYDWHRGAFGGHVSVPPGDLLVVEGVGAGARALDPFRTTLVWLDAPVDLRRRRALARDGDSFAPYWDHWAEVEERHFTAERTPERADLRFSPPEAEFADAEDTPDART